jgi:fatty acid desaturase
MIIALMQFGMFRLVGPDYLWIGPVAILVSSAVTMTYIFTNHFLDPILQVSDPLLGSTSVDVPEWMDKLHGNFSHHVEHHLFPAMSPHHFPQVRRVLEEAYPERYRRLPLIEAWRLLAQRPSWARQAPATSPAPLHLAPSRRG